MQRVWSVDLPSNVGRQVAIAGWLLRLRRLSQVSFAIVRDGRGLAQAVLDDRALIERIVDLPPESVVRLEGEVVATAQAPGGVELRAERLEVISAACAPPPFELHRPQVAAQLPTLLDHAAVGLRHARPRAMFRVAAASVEGFRRTLRAEHFVEVFTPKIVATATEGGANVFGVDYFGRPAYLAQSPQLYKQTLVGVFERVFEVGPVFRAEPHDTPRHLNQYVSLDAEMGFIADHTTVMSIVERAIDGMLAGIRQEASKDIELLGCELPRLEGPVPALDFVEAQQLIAAATDEDVLGEPDLAPSHERWLGDWAKREHGSEFLFITGYPLAKRPFYTYPHPQLPGQTHSFDLLFRGSGDRDRRPTSAPLRRLSGGYGRARPGPRAVGWLPGSVQTWHAAARGVCDGPGALGRPPDRGGQRPRNHPVPTRPAAAHAVTTPPPRRAELGEVAALFLKLGLIAFGGPAAHIAMIRDEVVRRRKWVSEQQFLDLLGASNLIPGPTSTELAIYLGYTRAGPLGLFVAGGLFILPAMLIVLAFAWAYVNFGTTPQATALLYGVKPVIIAIVIQAIYGLLRSAVKRWLLGVVVVLTLVLYGIGLDPLVPLFGLSMLVALIENGARLAGPTGVKGRRPRPRWCPAFCSWRWRRSPRAPSPSAWATLFLTFLKMGATLYGSGYVLLAFLRQDFVERLGWLSDQQIVDAVAVGQFTPGPVFTTATFVGYLVGGLPGAIVATIAIFLPSFVFVGLVYPFVPRLRRSPWTSGFLDGANAAAIGLMIAVTWQLGVSSIVDVLTAGLAVGAAVLLIRFKINSVWLVLGGAAVGCGSVLALRVV